MKPIQFIIIGLLLIIASETYFLFKKSPAFTTTKQAIQTIRDSSRQISDSMKNRIMDGSLVFSLQQVSAQISSFNGICTPYTDKLTPDYVKVQVNFKGSNLHLDNYMLGILDYASHPGCFNASPTGFTMVNYIKTEKGQSSFSFAFTLRSVDVTNNPFEYSAMVYDVTGKKLIGKFPKKDPSLKGTIQFLKYPVIIKDTIKLKLN